MEAGSDQDYEDPDNYQLLPVKKPSENEKPADNSQ